jgi:hypothetical protein
MHIMNYLVYIKQLLKILFYEIIRNIHPIIHILYIQIYRCFALIMVVKFYCLFYLIMRIF